MARIGLTDNIKFRRMVRLLNIPRPYVRGLLESMWEVGWQNVNPVLGSSLDVELAAEWPGELGQFTTAAVEAGFLDEERGIFTIHDYWDHAPDYVTKRYQRKQRTEQRVASVHTIVENGGQRRTTATDGRTILSCPVPPCPENPTPLPPSTDGQPVRPPIGKAMAEEAEFERRIARYTSSESDNDDRAVLRRVLTHLTSDRVSGKPLAHHKRVRFLDSLVRFEPGVVFIASHDFVTEGHLDAGKDGTYFVAMCEKSATSKYIEFMNQRDKENRHVDQKPKSAGQPRRIGDIMAPADAKA